MKHLLFLCMLLLMISCNNNRKPTPLVDIYKTDTTSVVKVPYQLNGEHEIVQVSFNGVPFNMLFDTGATITSITQTDFTALLNENAISKEDFATVQKATIANGDTIQSGVFVLDNVTIAGDNGKKITLHNVEISVDLESEGCRLLGKNIINQLGDFKNDRASHYLIFRAQ